MPRLLSGTILLLLVGCSTSTPTTRPSTRPAPTSPIPPYSGPEYSQLHRQLRGPLTPPRK